MIYVCSRLSAPTTEEMEQNMLKARMYCEIVTSKTGERAFAPHSFLPAYVDDTNPAERAIALEFGRRMLTICEEVIVVLAGLEPSIGMKGEIELAKELNIPIKYFEDIEELNNLL
jgi:hypothetical protein